MEDIFIQKKRGRKPKNKDNNDLISKFTNSSGQGSLNLFKGNESLNLFDGTTGLHPSSGLIIPKEA